MATRTIANGGGNYNATGSWVEGAVPTAADDVVATATSGNLTVNVASLCRSIDLTSYVGTLTVSSTLTVGTTTLKTGNVGLKFPSSGMTLAGSAGGFTFANSNATSNTIDFGGLSTGVSMTVNSNSTLLGPISTTGSITHTGRTFDTGGYNVTCAVFLTSGATARTLTLGASVFTLGTTSTSANLTDGYTGSNLTLNAGTSRIILKADCIFACNSATWYDVVFQGAGEQGSNTFNSVLSSPGTLHNLEWAPAVGPVRGNINNRLSLGGNVTLTGALICTGFTRSRRCVLYGGSTQEAADGWTTPASSTTIALGASGTATLTNVDFFGIAVTGTNAPVSGTAVGDCKGNSGVTFDTARNLYWVGGITGGTTNSFGDSFHWSATSGGSGGQPSPLPQDTAYFDANSGLSGIQAIPFDGITVGTGIVSTAAANTRFGVAGNYFVNSISFTGSSQLSGNANARFQLRPGPSQTLDVTMAASIFGAPMTVFGPGTVRLLGTVSNSSTITLAQGTINLNGQLLSGSSTFTNSSGLTRAIDWSGGGTMAIAGVYSQSATGLTMTNPGQGTLFVGANAGSFGITTGGITMPGLTKQFAGTSTLADNYISAGAFRLTQGTIDVGTKVLSGYGFVSSGTLTRTLTIGAAGSLELGGELEFSGSNFTFNPGANSYVQVSALNADTKVTTGGYTFIRLYLAPQAGGQITVFGGGEASNLDIQAPVGVGTVSFAGDWTVGSTFTANGNSAVNRLKVYGSPWGRTTTITTAVTAISNIDLININKAGAATWTGTSVTNSFTGWAAHAATT